MTTNVSDGYVIRFELDDIVRGGADDLARALLDSWRATQGRVCDEIANFTDHVVIMDGRPSETDSPDILFCGDQSLLVQKLSYMRADSPQVDRSHFSADYRQLCIQSYLDTALGSQPIFDLVQVTHPLTTGEFYKETYHRLLLPVTTDQGGRFTLCYSLDVQSPRFPTEPQQSRRHPGPGTAQNINLNMPYFPAAHPK